MRWGCAVIAAVLLLTAACGDSGGAPQSAPLSSSGPAPPPTAEPAVWSADLPPDVELRPADPLLPGPGLPDGAIVTEVLRFPGDRYEPPDGARLGAQTLYADPAVDDPADGRQVMIGRTDVSDDVGDPAEDGTVVEVGGHKARLAQGARPDSWIVSWSIGDDLDCQCAQYAVVAGLEVTRQEVLRAAGAAQPAAARPHVAAAALPDGLRSLGTTPADRLGLYDPHPRVRSTTDVDGLVINIINHAGDARLGVHLRFWDDLVHPDWQEVYEAHGQVLVADLEVGDGPPGGDDTVAAVVAALVPAEQAEVDAMSRTVLARPQDRADRCGGSSSEDAYLAGHVDGRRWIFGFREEGGFVSTCMDLIDPERGRGGGGGSAGHGTTSTSGVRLVSGTHMSSTNGVGYVAGDVPSGATRVVVDVGSAHAEAALAERGPTPERRWFVAIFPKDAPSEDVAAVVVAYGADGREIART